MLVILLIFGLHAKSMVIDNKTAVIGTFNLDPRSTNLNIECVTVIHNRKIAGDLFNVMAEEFKKETAWSTSLSYNPDHLAGWGKRFKVWIKGLVSKSIL